jgi:diacylglycerol kinase family enzyme
MLLDERSVGLRKATIILNKHAGGVRRAELPDRIRAAFQHHGWEAEVMMAGRSAPPDRLAFDAVARGDQILVAAGGDGTVGAVASAVAGSDSIMGVLPVGTLNHFARDLHIPFDVEAAIAVIERGKTANVDVGEVNGHVFVNNSSIGLYPSMVFERNLRQRTGRNKWIAMFWACLSVLRRFQRVRVRIKVGGKTTVRKTPFVFVGNNEYQIEGLNAGTRARLDSGHLAFYMAHSESRSRVIWLSLLALFGRLRTAKDFEVLSLDTVWIESRHRRLWVSFDGEIARLRTPLHYGVRPGALRVFVP